MNNSCTDWSNRSARVFAVLFGAIALCALSEGVAARASKPPQYSIIGAVSGPDGGWDYATVDPDARRLYVARQHGIAVLDLAARAWLPSLAPDLRGSGLAVVSDGSRVLASDSRTMQLALLNALTGSVVGAVSVGAEPDAVAFDASTGIAAAVTPGKVLLVDVERLALLSTIPIAGKLEFAVADGRGMVYVNNESTGELIALDLKRRAVARRTHLKGCSEPTGLALDAADGLLIAACGNKVATVVRAVDGVEIARVGIGEGADAVFYDAARKLAFVPCGESGTLVIIDLSDIGRIHVRQTLSTEVGARTGAVDDVTGMVYLPTGTPGPIVPPDHWPSLVPGTFKVLVVAPRPR